MDSDRDRGLTVDQELVNKIVKEVQQALGQGPRPAPTPARDVAPSSVARTTTAREPSRPAKVFITADALRRRVNGGEGKRTIELAQNEVLTPNAMDMVQQMHLEVRKDERSLADTAKTQAGETTSPEDGSARRHEGDGERMTQPSESRCKCPVGLVIHLGDGKVASVVDSIRGEGTNLVEFDKTDCPLRNMAELCEAIASGQVARGVVIARYAAGAMALAGKCKGIRPVQGTRPASVEAALRQFAANLLVIEHAFATFHEMRTMVRLFAAGGPGEPTDKAMMEAIARAEGR